MFLFASYARKIPRLLLLQVLHAKAVFMTDPKHSLELLDQAQASPRYALEMLPYFFLDDESEDAIEGTRLFQT